MFRIKICGVTNVADARLAARAGADAIGLNFYPKSKRYLAPETARDVAAALPTGVRCVGVFVNASTADILEVSEYVGLDWVQLHGDEPPEALAELVGQRIVRAFRCREGLQTLREYLDRCPRQPEAVLLDAYDSQSYGGTGQTLNWKRIAAEKSLLPEIPVVLAGGLNPANVAQAIRDVQPWAVDTSSGVETCPGQKDAELVTRFVRSAKAALQV